jgi:hypothetical protein
MPNARCYLPRGDAKGEQAGKPGRQIPTEGDPLRLRSAPYACGTATPIGASCHNGGNPRKAQLLAVLALQRTGSPRICGLIIRISAVKQRIMHL